MFGTMDLVVDGASIAEVEGEIAQVCGVMNAAVGRLVGLIAQVLEVGAWEGAGIRSAEQWVAWKCGVSPARARSLVTMARRLRELPDTKAAMDAGELCEDQVSVICRHAPAGIDGQAAELARSATVVQLRRVLGSHAFETDKASDPPAAEEVRRANFGHDDEGSWTLSAQLTADEGALVEKALAVARDELFRAGEHEPGPKPAPSDISWADALVAIAARSLAPGAECRPHHDRHLVLLHVDTSPDGAPDGHLHLGPGLSDGLRRFISCDARVRPVIETRGRPVSVGRAFRTVPDRTRMVIEERDRGCRFPGCERSRWLHIHHVEHWEDGGGSDTANLLALCQRHHRLHHLGRLGISGNADDPDGIVFTDERGRRLDAAGRPAPPGRPPEEAARDLGLPIGRWSHPTGERLDPSWVFFDERAG
jgi:hypothetical protein